MPAEAARAADVIVDVEFEAGVLYLVVRNIGDGPATRRAVQVRAAVPRPRRHDRDVRAAALSQDRVPRARAGDPDAARHDRGVLRPQGAGEARGHGDVARRRPRQRRSAAIVHDLSGCTARSRTRRSPRPRQSSSSPPPPWPLSSSEPPPVPLDPPLSSDPPPLSSSSGPDVVVEPVCVFPVVVGVVPEVLVVGGVGRLCARRGQEGARAEVADGIVSVGRVADEEHVHRHGGRDDRGGGEEDRAEAAHAHRLGRPLLVGGKFEPQGCELPRAVRDERRQWPAGLVEKSRRERVGIAVELHRGPAVRVAHVLKP